MKSTDHAYTCNDLTNFEYVVLDTTGNGSFLNLQKTKFKKIVKLTDHTYTYNDLTNIEYLVLLDITGNGSYLNLQKNHLG